MPFRRAYTNRPDPEKLKEPYINVSPDIKCGIGQFPLEITNHYHRRSHRYNEFTNLCRLIKSRILFYGVWEKIFTTIGYYSQVYDLGYKFNDGLTALKLQYW